MKLKDVHENIGKECTIGGGDLAIYHDLRDLIFNERVLTIVKVTKGGMVYLQRGNHFYTVPAKYIHLIAK